MSTTPVQAELKQTPSELVISNRFKEYGVTQSAFLKGKLTPAMLQAYLTSVAPFEVYSTPEEKAAWVDALIKNKEMIRTAGQKPLSELETTQTPAVKPTIEK